MRVVVSLFFPHDFGNLVVVCGLNSERGFILPQGTNCQNSREVSQQIESARGTPRWERVTCYSETSIREIRKNSWRERRMRWDGTTAREFVSSSEMRVLERNHNSYSIWCCEPCGVVIREITVDNVAIFHVRYIRKKRAIWNVLSVGTGNVIVCSERNWLDAVHNNCRVWAT